MNPSKMVLPEPVKLIKQSILRQEPIKKLNRLVISSQKVDIIEFLKTALRILSREKNYLYFQKKPDGYMSVTRMGR